MSDSIGRTAQKGDKTSVEKPNGDLNGSSRSRKLKMLIVDDEPSVCFTLKLIFEQEGFVVTTAASAAEGTKILGTGQLYDLIMTDLHMEREDAGFDLVRAARNFNPDPIVIVVTGYASVKNARVALDAHVDHFAIKPIELSEFLEAVRRLMGARADAQSVSE